MKKKRWLSILLSLSMVLALLPAQAFAEEGPEGTEITCTRSADCEAEVHEPDCPLWQEDSTGPGETTPEETGTDETEEPSKPEETQPTAAEVLALIEALPDPGAVTAENAEAAETQLRELLALYQALDADGQEEVGEAILRAIELKAALDALNGEASGQAMLAATVTGVTYQDVEYDADGNVQFDSAGQVKYITKTTDEGVAVSREDVKDGILTWDAGWYVVNSDVKLTDVETIFVQGDVHLILVDGYTLTAEGGICVPSGSSLTIYGQSAGTGGVTATTSWETCAGIGGVSAFPTSGSITINGGTVTAQGGGRSAGIGDGQGGAGSGTITINGGTVTASGGWGGAGIGGGYNGRVGNITINGGVVSATGGSDGRGINCAGIGGGGGSSQSADPDYAVTIRGGTVTATGGGGVGMGIGCGSDRSIPFSTTAADGTPGNAFIVTNSISSHTSNQTDWSGVIITGSTGTVYGSPTLTTDATVPAGVTLTVPQDSTLTIYEDVTLINNGTIINNGAIWNGGTIYNAGTIAGPGTIEGNPVQNGVFVDYQAYDDANGEFTKQNHFAVPVTDQTTWGTSGQETWYVVNDPNGVTISDRITVNGNVHLILADDCTLTASKGITVTGDNSLIIYAQTPGGGYIEGTTGKLEATGGDQQAGIGGESGQSNGKITITGGRVIATGGSNSNGSYGGAGIGGGCDGSGSNITINGGTVTATGGSNSNGSYGGAGIGGGYNYSGDNGNGSNIFINGGTVTASGGSYGAGIGGGCDGSGSDIFINGGTVKANGGSHGAGIGGGYYGSGSDIFINGGTVTANGGSYGAGIGGGYYGSGSNITISGGTVTANGGFYGAGIGGGSNKDGSNIIISGGEVTAKGGSNGAGIGGGYYGSGSDITISGGTVMANGDSLGAGIGGGSNKDGSNITISGGTVTAIGGSKNATAIGGSIRGSGSNITISGGTVTAIGNGQGAGIGGGYAGNFDGLSTKVDGTVGNAFIVTSSIKDTGESSNWSGVIITGSTYDSATETANGGTGQVYGIPTLTTNAEVPSGASLTIPGSSTLTLAQGMTLTNSGAICMEGGSLLYGDPDYGTLTNDGGTICYLLTVNGGSATAGTATYNGKTYAEAGISVTLTADAKVGLAFNGEWTTSPETVTVTDNQFTMPAQPLTVTAGDYTNAPTYTVTIPKSVTIGGEDNPATISASGVNVAADYSLNVKLTGTGTDGTGTDFTLTLADDNTETLAYTVTKGTGEVKVNDTVLTVAGGKANSSGSSTLTFNLAENAVVKYSGSYTGTVTFTVSVEQVSTGGTD